MATWLELAPMPLRGQEHQFIPVSPLLHRYKNKNTLYIIPNIVSPAHPLTIHKYDFDDDSWSELNVITTMPARPHANLCQFGFNNSGDNMYAIDTYLAKMTVFNFDDNNNCKVEHTKIVDAIAGGYKSAAMIHKNEMHVVGAAKFKHFKCDLRNYKCTEVNDLAAAGVNNLKYADYCASIKTQGQWILFGGYRRGKCFDSIWFYDINDNSWNTSTTKLPKAIYEPACTTISNGNVVLILGGNSCNGRTNEIYMYHVKEGKCTKSRAKLPSDKLDYVLEWKAVTWSHPINDNLLVNGWMKRIWKQCQMNEHLFPPQYLLKLIEQHSMTEMVDIFAARTTTLTLRHYRMTAMQLFE